MEQYIIKGGNPLVGEVEIGGSKNAALPILAASLMTDETVADVHTIGVPRAPPHGRCVVGLRVDAHCCQRHRHCQQLFSVHCFCRLLV